MAIIQDNDEELNTPNQQQVSTPNQGAASGVGTQTSQTNNSGAGAIISSPGGGASAAPTVGGTPGSTGVSASATNPSQSGLFTNLSQYLNNNVDNASGVGNTVGSFFQNTAGSAENTLGSNQSDFDNQIGAGTINFNQDLANQAVADPNTFTQNSQNVGSYQNMVNGTYSGPTDFATSQDYANSAAPIAQYDQYTASLAQPNQYNNLLSTIYQGTPYTPGEVSLDSALLANNPNVLSSVNNTVQGIGSLDNKLANATTTENQNVAQGQATTGSTNASAGSAITGAETNLQNLVNQAVTTAQGGAQTNFTNLQNTLNQYNGYTPNGTAAPLTADQLSQLGVTADQWKNLLQNVGQWNTTYANGQNAAYSPFGSLSSYLSTPGTSGITASNVATPDQYNTLNSLQTLLGPTAQPNQFLTNPEQAGTAPTNIGSFDYTNALSAVNSDINSAANKAPSAAGGGSSGGGTSGVEEAIQIVGTIATVVAIVVCHVEGTLILMSDGTSKKIEDIELGDDVFKGGIILGTGRAYNDDIYDYNGILVSGSHAVKEDKWIRVRDSKISKKLDGTKIVVPLVTQNHIFYTNDHQLWSDFAEVDNGHLMNEDERLKALNGNS